MASVIRSVINMSTSRRKSLISPCGDRTAIDLLFISEPHALEQSRATIVKALLTTRLGFIAEHLRQKDIRVDRDRKVLLLVEYSIPAFPQKRDREIVAQHSITVEIGAPVGVDWHIRRGKQQIAAPVVAVKQLTFRRCAL